MTLLTTITEEVMKNVDASADFFLVEKQEIEKIVSLALETVRERVEKMKINFKDKYYGKSEVEWGFENIHNQAINQVLTLLDTQKKDLLPHQKGEGV